MTPRSGWRARVLLAAALAAFLVKLGLAAFTIGTNDVVTFERMLADLNEHGVTKLYREGTLVTIDGREVGRLIMNHPPFILHVLRAWGALTHATGLPLAFWMRITCALADLLAVWLLWRMSARLRLEWAALVLVALAPAALLISGFHGNTDPIMIAFALAAVYLLDRGERVWLAGAAFAVACSVKAWPLVLVPAVLFYVRPFRAKIVFALSAVGTAVLPGLPWIVTDTALIVQNVLGYGSLSGWWGLTYLLPVPWRPAVATVMFAGVLAVQTWMHERVAPLYMQCAVIAAVFLLLASGFGPQYLAWMVPWTAAAGWRLSLPFHVASGVYLLGLYTAWSNGWLYFADAHKYGIPLWVYRAGLMTWATLALVLAGAYRRGALMRDRTPRTTRELEP